MGKKEIWKTWPITKIHLSSYFWCLNTRNNFKQRTNAQEVEELSPREKYSFKRKLEELEAIRGQHTELITLYIPPDKQIYDVVAQLRDEYSQS